MPTPTYLYLIDSNGQNWELNVNPDGSLQTTEISAPPSPPSEFTTATSSTITLRQTIEWAKKFIFLRPTAIGNQLEPALTNANIIAQTILGAPFIWRWNRNVTGFITAEGQQDYTLFNWTKSFNITDIFVTVDTNGNCQACTTAGQTGLTFPNFNDTKGDTTTDGTAIWTNMGPINTPVSINYTFAWMETQALQETDINTDEPKWKEFEPKISLGLDSALARPKYIAAQGDDGNGNITFRMMPVPDQSYPVAITLQQKPVPFTSINQTWAPIPDEYAHIFNWGFLSLTFLFADDPRFQVASQKFISSLLSTNTGLTQTERNIVLNNWEAITGQPIVKESTNQQAFQGRASL